MADPKSEYERVQALADDGHETGAPADAGAPEEPTDPAPAAEAPDHVAVDDSVVRAAADDTTEPAATTDPPASGDTVDVDLHAALAQATREREEFLDHLRRERAEFENFRKRSVRERQEAGDRGAEALVRELLSVLDNFTLVLRAAASEADSAVTKGAAMVHEELRDVLTRAGLDEVPGEGAPFDPQWHEAMLQVEAEEGVDEPTVAEVLRTGYRFKGRVIRPASVAVAQ